MMNFLIQVLLLQTIQERIQFKIASNKLINIYQCYMMYLTDQILGKVKDDYGFNAFKRFFMSLEKQLN